ncbi:unnamed protein product [Lampetra planeri]
MEESKMEEGDPLARISALWKPYGVDDTRKAKGERRRRAAASSSPTEPATQGHAPRWEHEPRLTEPVNTGPSAPVGHLRTHR